jgi:membrane associated rhomboid family serine protease
MFKNIVDKPLFKELIICAILLYSLDSLAWKYHLYYQEIGGEFDSFMHFLGGLTTALGVLWLYFFSGIFEPRNRKYSNFFLITVLGIIFVGFAWEIYEILAGTMSINEADYMYDTTLDVIFDVFGVISGCIYGFKLERKIKLDYGN